jgi:PAS domain S-box-containing protein
LSVVSRLGLRSILLLTVGALTLMILVLVSQEMYRNWQRLGDFKGLRDAIALSDLIFDSNDTLSLERDVATSLLDAPDAVAVEGLRERLRAARSAANETIKKTISALDRYSFPELVDLRAKSTARLATILALRDEIDRAVARPKAERDPGLSQRWSNEVSAFLTERSDVWNTFVGHFTNIDAAATQRLRFRYLLRTIIDYASRERAIIGSLIVENKDPTTEQVISLLRGQGTVDQAWQMSRMLAQHGGLFPTIASEYTDARSHYDTLHDMIQDVFYVPRSGHGKTYPIAIDLWIEMSTQVNDSLFALRDASTSQTRRYAARLIADSETQIAKQAAIFLAALLLCGYCFSVITGRVVRPINALVEALVAATRGERVVFAVSGNRNDEIGKLAQVLEAFHERMEQITRTSSDLDRSRSVLRAVVDHAVDGLVTIEAGGTVKSFNPACERIFGYTAAEIIGQPFTLLLPDSDSDDPGLAFAFAQGTIGITGTGGREFTAKRKDGSHFPVDLSISAFTLDGVQHFSAIVRDITARKEAEQQLLDYTQALERSNKELDDFAYIASHDLKEPLRGIHNHSRFLLEDNAEKLDKESVDRLDRLVYLSQRMERLVNDLLYFSRLGRQELAIQPTDLGAVITDIEATLENFLEERKASITVAAKMPVIVCDRPRVTELFRNLITNAVKYNDKAEKTVEIGWLATHKTSDGHAMRNVLYVKDDGRGIAPEFHNEIFRIFKRLQGNKDGEEGTGVGLTFVKKIVERHGGRIWLESAPGRGTTFYFTLEASHDEHDHGSQVAA